MKCWANASSGDKKLFEAISRCTQSRPQLLDFLFDPERPKLRAEASELIDSSRSLSSGDSLLVKLAIDLWMGKPEFSVGQLFELEPNVFNDAIQSLLFLAHGS